MKAPIIRRQISEALTKDATVLNRTGSRGSVPKSVVTLEVLETERSMSKTLLISLYSLSSLGRQSGNFAPRQILKAWKWIVNCLIRQRPIKSYSLKKLIRQLRGKKIPIWYYFQENDISNARKLFQHRPSGSKFATGRGDPWYHLHRSFHVHQTKP